jgi:hypothetical protein
MRWPLTEVAGLTIVRRMNGHFLIAGICRGIIR